MKLYYSNSVTAQKYNMETVIPRGDKTVTQLKNEIISIPNFCRDEYSLEVNELKSYLNQGITIYALNDSNILVGVLNFDVNKPSVFIYGLCAPKPAIGAGTELIDVVKKFAEMNGLESIKLTCYGAVVKFYENKGFRIQNTSVIHDEDEDSDEEEGKTKYDVSYTVMSGTGGRKKKYKKKSKNIKRSKKTRKTRRRTTRH